MFLRQAKCDLPWYADPKHTHTYIHTRACKQVRRHIQTFTQVMICLCHCLTLCKVLTVTQVSDLNTKTLLRPIIAP